MWSSGSSSLSSVGGAGYAVIQVTLLGQSCPAPVGRAGGLSEIWVFELLFSCGFFWWISPSPPRFIEALTTPKSLSQCKEITVFSSLSSQDIWSLFLSTLLKPAVFLVMHPTTILSKFDLRTGHVSVICASKTVRHPQFMHMHLKFLDPVWGLN